MDFDQHFYFYKGNRIPRPENLVVEREKLFIFGLPWGHRDSADTYLQKFSDFVVAAKEDSEATSPFPRFPQFSNSLNNLQIAAQITNQNIMKQKNQQELQMGMELFACYVDNEEFGWVSYGGPQLLLWKKSGDIRSLQSSNNLASSREADCPLLPKHQLGIHRNINVQAESIRWNPEDKVFLLYTSSRNPFRLDNIQSQDRSLKNLVDLFQKQDPKQSFWAAEIIF